MKCSKVTKLAEEIIDFFSSNADKREFNQLKEESYFPAMSFFDGISLLYLLLITVLDPFFNVATHNLE